MKVELLTCPSGDWKVLLIDDKVVHSGHNIPDFVWLDTLYHANVDSIKSREISDEDMECANYGTK
jgi:hypothetical protein